MKGKALHARLCLREAFLGQLAKDGPEWRVFDEKKGHSKLCYEEFGKKLG